MTPLLASDMRALYTALSNYPTGSLATYINFLGIFPNNEIAIRTIVAVYGIDVDLRYFTFHNQQTGPSTARHSLRIRHEDLDGFYGYLRHYFTWRDYIDAAVATGYMTGINLAASFGSTDLIDPTLANQPDRDANGYLINFGKVNQIITTGFATNCPTGQYCTRSQAVDCDRTFSTICA